MTSKGFVVGIQYICQMNSFQKILIMPFTAMIRIYQIGLSPWLGSSCRFTPSCSNYMMEALKTHGLFKGLKLGTKRIMRCHPWGGSGYDPVPKKEKL